MTPWTIVKCPGARWMIPGDGTDEEARVSMIKV
jgi:hypothetical protein